jgi:hypothetical protein
MGILVYGTRFVCDLCGVTGDSPVPWPGVWADQPRPEGWMPVSADLQAVIRDPHGHEITHLCESCSLLNVREFVARVRARPAPGR